MDKVFADSVYFFALLVERDQFRERAIEAAGESWSKIVTTEWILMEVGDGLSSVSNRRAVTPFIERLRTDEIVDIVPASRESFDGGLRVFENRPDKEWSLTDCISFVVMKELKITKALTADHHFQQAGFEALFI